MNSKQKTILKKLGLFSIFFCALLVFTRFALHLGGDIANPTTVGFSFLIVVVLAAVFAGLGVAIATSIIAALLLNYYFFFPTGTFRIADQHNWIALSAFLFTSIVISRLTASAHENARKAESMEMTVVRLHEFGSWLLSQPLDRITLSSIADGALRMFHLEYCSIHVYAEGKWHHFSGTSVGSLNQQIAESLKVTTDHPTGIVELAEEQGLGVRYSPIRTGENSVALLVVKNSYLTNEAIHTIAAMIGITLVEIVSAKHTSVG